MEFGVIVYYYPMKGEAKAGLAAKKHWFQEAVLRAERLCEDQVWGCAVPPFYYKKRTWSAQALSEAMDVVLGNVEGMADTYVHPQVGQMLTEEYLRRFIPRRTTVQTVTERLIERYAGDVIRRCGEVTVLLGKPADTDWQMEMTRALLLPYLPRINQLALFYEEVEGADIWMELGSYLDEYYYEYGLVPQLEPYLVNGHRETGMPGDETARQEEKEMLRCGKNKCSGLILDYCERFRYPRILAEKGAVYVDTASGAGKEQMLRRRTPQIPYFSPLKYLDTMVKNSYDGLL